MKKTWDFLQVSIPEFQHSDESLSEMKPQAEPPAAEREARLNESPLPGPERSKGLSYASQEKCVCTVTHINLNYTLHI